MQPLTRAAVVAQVEARLAGQLSDAALAAWAFDRFYEEELAAETEERADQVLADAVEALMFADEAAFALSEDELRTMIARLMA